MKHWIQQEEQKNWGNRDPNGKGRILIH